MLWKSGDEEVDLLYRLGWNGLMNVVIAAIAVFLVRSVFILGKKQVNPYIWGIVFLGGIFPVGLFHFPESGYVVEALLGSSLKFYFFLLWEGIAVLLVASGFLKCRKNKWMALECEALGENVYIMKGIKKAQVCGFFHPVIYLPEGLDEKVQQTVLERKRRMIDRGGQKLRVFASIVTYLNWYNPILWFSLYYLKEDMKRI